MPDNKLNQLSNSVGSDELSVNDIDKFLKMEDSESPNEETETKVEEEVESEEESEDEESEDEEIELKDEEEEPNLEEITSVRRQDILKKYPTLFKDFPDLERAYYRDRKYTEYFATPQDAEEAVARLETFDNLETSVMDGNPETLLSQIRENDKESLVSFAENFLPTLSKIDKGTYDGIIGNLLKTATATMLEAANKSTNEDAQKALRTAASIFYQFMFGTQEFQPPQPLSKKKDNSDESKLAEERAQFVRQKFESAANDVTNKTDNVLKSVVDKFIDPKNVMGPYVRNNAIKDVMSKVHEHLNNDAAFKKVIDKLWEQAFKEDFSDSIRTRIRNTWFNAAKPVIQQAIKEVRAEALKGQAFNTRNKPVQAGRPTNPTNRISEGKAESKKVPMNIKTLDFLNSD